VEVFHKALLKIGYLVEIKCQQDDKLMRCLAAERQIKVKQSLVKRKHCPNINRRLVMGQFYVLKSFLYKNSSVLIHEVYLINSASLIKLIQIEEQPTMAFAFSTKTRHH